MNTALFFDSYFDHAELNSFLKMECDGTIVSVNQAFTKNYGYMSEDLAGRNFRVLFNERDRELGKPEQELEAILTSNQAHDENYIVDKKGNEVWSLGEAILVDGGEGKKYIVKDIINLQSKKQLELFLTETEVLLEKIFQSSEDIPMMVLDGSMKILKVNKAFMWLFHLARIPGPGARLADIDHPFWSDIKAELAHVLVTNQPIRNKTYQLQDGDGNTQTILLSTKIIEGRPDVGRRIFVIVHEKPS